MLDRKGRLLVVLEVSSFAEGFVVLVSLRVVLVDSFEEVLGGISQYHLGVPFG